MVVNKGPKNIEKIKKNYKKHAMFVLRVLSSNSYVIIFFFLQKRKCHVKGLIVRNRK